MLLNTDPSVFPALIHYVYPEAKNALQFVSVISLLNGRQLCDLIFFY